MKLWKDALNQDESADHVIIPTGSKRKAVSMSAMHLVIASETQSQDVSVDEAELRSRWDAGTVDKVRGCKNFPMSDG